MSREELERQQLGRLGDLTEPIKRERGEMLPVYGSKSPRGIPGDMQRQTALQNTPQQVLDPVMRARAGQVEIPSTYPVYDTLPANGLILNQGNQDDFSYGIGDDPPSALTVLTYTVPYGRVLRLTGFQVNVYSGVYEPSAPIPTPAGVPNILFFVTLKVDGNAELTNQRIPVEPLDDYLEAFLIANGGETLEMVCDFSDYPIVEEPNTEVQYSYVARIRGHILTPNELPYKYTTLGGRAK